MGTSLTADQRAEVAKYRAAGWGARAIANKIGSTRGVVRWHIDHTKAEGAAPEVTFRTLVYDIECTNLRTDLGLLLCVAFYDMADGSIEAKTIDDFGPSRKVGEKELVKWAAEKVASADCLIGFNSDAFDKHYLDGVSARHGLPRLPKRIHIDLYQSARYGWGGLPSSYSLRNLTEFFHLERKKTSLDKTDWREALADPAAMVALRIHCEEDVDRTALLWQAMKGYYFDWRGK